MLDLLNSLVCICEEKKILKQRRRFKQTFKDHRKKKKEFDRRRKSIKSQVGKRYSE